MEGEAVETKFPQYKDLMVRIKEQGKPYGCKFEKVSVLANTHKALLVGEYAKTIGKSEAYTVAMFEAYFTEGKNLGDTKVVEEVSASVGISADEVEKAIQNEAYETILKKNSEWGHEIGINSVPTFIINDKYMMVGAQPPEQFENVFKQIQSGGVVL